MPLLSKRRISTIGKILRTMRINRNETQNDMARNLGITNSFLSNIELGKKAMNEALLRKIKECYQLDEESFNRLEEAMIKEKIVLKFNLSEFSKSKKEFLYNLYGKIQLMNDDLCNEINHRISS